MGDDLLPKLRRALRRARLDFGEVVEKARRGEVQFLEVEGAVAITALTSSGSYRTCHVIAIAGDLSTMPALDAKVEEWARTNGCQAVEADGRLGWSRIAPPSPGYAAVGVKYRKLLERSKL